MIGLDTNVLARYFIDDADGDPVVQKQRESAKRLVESGVGLFISKTVLLEFEWVMRGFYELEKATSLKVLAHLLEMALVDIEDRNTVEQALSHSLKGLEFADALHLASNRECERLASFDDKKFARKTAKLGLTPKVFVPA